MNKKNIIITIAIFIVIVALFLLWRFVIGFKLTTESKFRNVVKNISDMSVYIVGNDDQRVEIDNKDDVNECIDYFMGECQNSCSFCPLEDRYGREY